MKNTIICLSIAALFFCLSCQEGAVPSRITFSHILSDTSEWHVGAAKWKELVEERQGEQISIRLVTHASLSNNNQRNELEMVQAGTLGGSWESSILLTNSDKRWTVWSMPWLFESYEEAEAVCLSDLGREMLDSLESIGIVGLAYGFNGFRHLTNNERVVAAPRDIENLKIRVPSLQMYISLYRLWGADPSQMNFGDLFVALQEGTMDGQENPLHVIRSSKLYELQDHLTLWQYSFDPIVFCMSKRVWDRLAPETQTVLREAAEEAAALQRKTVMENEEKHKAFLKEHGVRVTVPSQQAVAAFREASQPMYHEYKEIIGKDLLKRFEEAAKNPL